MALKLETLVQGGTAILERAIARRQNFLIRADGTVQMSRCYLRQDDFP